MDEYLSIAEAARELGLSESALRTRVERGYVQAQRAGARLWLIPRVEVEKWRSVGRLKPWQSRKRQGMSRDAPSDRASTDA